jgi:glycosyltransferase involved in cell wall biosynthesis
MTPLVSILIPAYDAQPWLADTIRSALAQTWPRKEIIVVDDGSRDQTLSIARQFSLKNVCVSTQENQGPSAARNRALALSQGDYIQWLDADDLLAPDKVSKQMEAANECQSKRVLLSSAWGAFMYRVSKAQFSPTSLWCDLSPVEWLLRKMGQNLHMQTATWLVSRELTEAAGLWNTRLFRDNDGEYFCRVIVASDRIRFVPDAKVFYRTTDANRVSYIGRSNKKLDALFLSIQLHIGYLRSLEDSPRTLAACVTYLQTWFRNFYPDRPDIVKQAQDLATTLEGQLHVPRLGWKYAWIQGIFGYRTAKRAQLFLFQLKSFILRTWDKFLWRTYNWNAATRNGVRTQPFDSLSALNCQGAVFGEQDQHEILRCAHSEKTKR